MPGREAVLHVEETPGCEGERGRSAATNIIKIMILIFDLVQGQTLMGFYTGELWLTNIIIILIMIMIMIMIFDKGDNDGGGSSTPF